MGNKIIKFRDNLAKLILAGDKELTWRLFDDKNLQRGDISDFINWESGEVFAKAELVDVWEKRMGELEDSDFEGHEKFSSEDEMYQIYRTYYGKEVGPETEVKIIRFKLL